MKKIILTFIAFNLTLLNAGVDSRSPADVLSEERGFGTRGTGLESEEQGFGTRGTGVEMDERGIGTRGTGIGTRGTGFGTRGTDFNPFGVGGKDYQAETQARIRSNPRYSDLFSSSSLVLASITNSYLSSKQLSFDDDPRLRNLAPLSFDEWAAIHAGGLINLFEKTKWELVEDQNNHDNKLSFDYFHQEKTIQITSSSFAIHQSLKSNLITKTLVEFFLYAGAPFEYSEIYNELIPYEREVVDALVHPLSY